MENKNLDALVRTGLLHHEASNEEEVNALVASGKVRLIDAGKQDLSIESRFDLAYNAAHSLALASLRQSGYRSSKRYLVFQCLEHTLAIPAAQWRVLDSAHKKRNNAEYEGVFDVSEELVDEVISVSTELLSLLESGNR